MLKMSSSGSNTGMQTLPPLVNCIVKDALLHVSPHVNQTSLQVVHILYFCLVDTLLHFITPQILWSTGFRSGLFGGYKSSEINAGVSRSRRLIVSHAMCAGALSCWKQFLNINISHGSVVTHLRCDEMFQYDLIANLPLSLTVKEFWKSVNIWRSYRQKYSGMFFWLTVY